MDRRLKRNVSGFSVCYVDLVAQSCNCALEFFQNECFRPQILHGKIFCKRRKFPNNFVTAKNLGWAVVFPLLLLFCLCATGFKCCMFFAACQPEDGRILENVEGVAIEEGCIEGGAEGSKALEESSLLNGVGNIYQMVTNADGSVSLVGLDSTQLDQLLHIQGNHLINRSVIQSTYQIIKIQYKN